MKYSVQFLLLLSICFFCQAVDASASPGYKTDFYFVDEYTQFSMSKDATKGDWQIKGFDPEKKTTFVVTDDLDALSPLAYTYARNGYNSVLLVYQTTTNDAAMQYNMNEIGQCLYVLVDELNVAVPTIALVGHHQGANVVGYTARAINIDGTEVPFVCALDPRAPPCDDPSSYISPTDALTVVVLHNTLALQYYQSPLGRGVADIYSFQDGPTVLDAAVDGSPIQLTSCADYIQARSTLCFGTESEMSYPPSVGFSGLYSVKTA